MLQVSFNLVSMRYLLYNLTLNHIIVCDQLRRDRLIDIVSGQILKHYEFLSNNALDEVRAYCDTSDTK